MDQEKQIPSQYKPISAWGYFGYNILFSIPLVGFILLIVFSFDSSNINRRNYARSFFILTFLIIIITIIILLTSGIGLAFSTINT